MVIHAQSVWLNFEIVSMHNENLVVAAMIPQGIKQFKHTSRPVEPRFTRSRFTIISTKILALRSYI